MVKIVADHKAEYVEWVNEEDVDLGNLKIPVDNVDRDEPMPVIPIAILLACE